MLHNEERHLIIQALNHHIPVKEIAECFSVNTCTIYRLRKQMKMTGSVETRTSLRGRKPVLSNDDIVHIDNLIQQHPDITINEIMDTLHLKVSDEAVRQAVLKLGYVYKKKSLHASEQERPRHPAETGKLAAAYSGERRKTTTILPSIRLDGTCIYTTYQGGTTAERFENDLESELLPFCPKPSGKLFLPFAYRIVLGGFMRVIMCNNLLVCYKYERTAFAIDLDALLASIVC